MKKLFFVVALFTTLVVNKEANAQQTAGNLGMDAAILSAPPAKENAATIEIKKDSVNTNALKHFKKAFKYAKDVKWMPLSDGYMAVFESDDFVERVFYHSTGNLCGTLKGYTADRLPGDIIKMVKKAYPNHTIVYADEVEVTSVPGAVTYFVHIQLNQDLKIIRICEEDMDVYFDVEKNINRF